MGSLLLDLRYGLRLFRKNPMVTAVAVMTLALGIGATTAIFLFVNAGLIHAVPYRDADRLMRLTMVKKGEFGDFEASYPNYLDWRAQSRTFESMGGYASGGNILWAGAGNPQSVSSATVSGNFFSILGVIPRLGRLFNDADEQSAENRALVISYACWQKRFGGRANVLGQGVTFGRLQYVIVGVLPPTFEFAPVGTAEIYVPPPTTGGMFTRRNLHWFFVIGKLKPGVTIAQANSDLQTISDQLARLYPTSNGDTGVKIISLREAVVGQIRPVLLLLFAAAGFVLLLACANVANVLLARAAARRQEMAVRSALGARRARIIRQVLTESVLLSLAAGVASLIVARLGIAALMLTVPDSVQQTMPFLADLTKGWTLILSTIAVSIPAGLLFGLAPALRTHEFDLHSNIGAGARSTARQRGLRDSLVVSEIAIAAGLLVISGLFLQSVFHVVHADPGFNRHGLLLLSYALPPNTYKDPATVIKFRQDIERRIAALPGVVSVGETDSLPLSDCDGCNTSRFMVEGKPRPQSAVQPEAASRGVSRDYLATLQARRLKGRGFRDEDFVLTPGDNGSSLPATPVVIVNRTLEREYFDGDAVGKHLTFTFAPGQPAREIVGVVDDVKEGFLDSRAHPTLYTPIGTGIFADLVVRTAVDPASMANSVRSATLGVEPDLAIFTLQTMDQRVADSTTMFLHNLPAILVSAFGGLALLLAAIGIYGVISYSVAQRTREFGVRMALGAAADDLLRLVLGGGLRLTVLGIAAGILGAAALARIAAGMLFGIRAIDVLTCGALLALVAAIAIVASYVPARRAAKLDPMQALRYE